MDLSNLKISGINDPWKNGAELGWKIVNAAHAEEDQVIEADVAIIGSGAGGGVSAEIMAAAGLKVVLIEAARLKSSDEFNMDEGEAYRDLYQEAAARGSKDGAITILQGRAVGGTTVVNWTSSFRTPEQTLAFWNEHYGVADTLRADMNPWFEKMEQRLKISKWVMPPNANNDVLKKGCEKLGWGWSVIPRNVEGCWNLGYCGMGCPTNAKQSMLVTTIPAAMSAGATLIHSAEARTLQQKDGKVTAILCRALDKNKRPTGVTISVKAKTVIAAGGGINTPALLMRSKVPDPHALIGKRTFLHATTFAFGDYEQPVDGFYGAPQSTYSDEFVWRDGADGAMGYKLEIMPMHPGLISSLTGGFGKKAFDELSRLPHLSSAIALLRDGFHEQSVGGTVELNDAGEPMLDYPITEYLLDGAKRSHYSMVEMHFAAGAKRVRAGHAQATFSETWEEAKAQIDALVYEPGFVGIGSAHVMGGCPLGEDESRCVTDSDGKFKYLDNLYIFDGSVFPTSLGVNPQLTIYGMTAKNATALAQRLTEQNEQV
jgi:choline dehydrogenase-like flavoprotein